MSIKQSHMASTEPSAALGCSASRRRTYLPAAPREGDDDATMMMMRCTSEPGTAARTPVATAYEVLARLKSRVVRRCTSESGTGVRSPVATAYEVLARFKSQMAHNVGVHADVALIGAAGTCRVVTHPLPAPATCADAILLGKLHANANGTVVRTGAFTVFAKTEDGEQCYGIVATNGSSEYTSGWVGAS